jgi:uncharacterized protein (TIGR00725 family)
MEAATTARDKVVTVFGSSRPKPHDPAYGEARALGQELARAGLVVCTGGYSGVMEAVSRGAKEAGGKTLGITADFFRRGANAWVDEEVRMKTWQDRLFELIRRGDGYAACRGGTGTLAELAVVWEMLNKAVLPPRPFVALGPFWLPILERVREVETGHRSARGEANRQLIHQAATPADAAGYLAGQLAGAA